MPLRSLLSRQSAALALLISALAACAEAPLSPNAASLVSRSASTLGEPEPSVWDRTVWVCKVGTDAEFAVSVDGGAPTPASVADGNCEAVYTQLAGLDENHQVSVTELAAAGVTLDSIVAQTTRFGLILSREVLTGTATASAEVTWTKGAIFTFYNTPMTPPPPPPPPPPPGGGEGCTPGYWKQAQHFDSWVGYTPNTLFSSVFEDAFPGMTLLQVLGQGGGGIKALGRHTVAALLNTANVGVEYGIGTPGEVISAFNDVFPGGDYTTLKNRLEGFNESGCPLN